MMEIPYSSFLGEVCHCTKIRKGWFCWRQTWPGYNESLPLREVVTGPPGPAS